MGLCPLFTPIFWPSAVGLLHCNQFGSKLFNLAHIHPYLNKLRRVLPIWSTVVGSRRIGTDNIVCAYSTPFLCWTLCGGASSINTGILAFCGGAASFFHTDILAFCGGALAVQASWIRDTAFGSQTSCSDNAETRFDLQEHSGFPAHWLGQYCLHELNTDPLLAFCGGALPDNTGILAFCGGAPHCARPDHLLGSLDWAASIIQFICVAHNTANSAFGRILQPDCIVHLIHYAH